MSYVRLFVDFEKALRPLLPACPDEGARIVIDSVFNVSKAARHILECSRRAGFEILKIEVNGRKKGAKNDQGANPATTNLTGCFISSRKLTKEG
jgi:hypothetical protein